MSLILRYWFKRFNNF